MVWLFGLGRRVVKMLLELTIEQLNAKETRMKNGGYYKPTHCHSQHKSEEATDRQTMIMHG